MAHPICQLQTLKLRIPPSYFLARLNFAPSVKNALGQGNFGRFHAICNLATPMAFSN